MRAAPAPPIRPQRAAPMYGRGRVHARRTYQRRPSSRKERHRRVDWLSLGCSHDALPGRLQQGRGGAGYEGGGEQEHLYMEGGGCMH